MEIENIVANTVYIKARESQRADGSSSKGRCGRSKKWKDLLALPCVSECLPIKDELLVNYQFIIDQQPIGWQLFKDYCAKHANYDRACRFLQTVQDFDTCPDEERSELSTEICQQYLHPAAPYALPMLSDEQFNMCQSRINSHTPEQVFIECKQLARDYLAAEPFSLFVASPYFERYLQWKWVERQPVDKHTFRLYRVLGKGGFGEVCACQNRSTGKMYALKKLEKKRIKKRHGESMTLNEKQILQRVNSRFVVSLAYAYEVKDALCLVLTLMNGGDLKFHLHNLNMDGFDEPRAQFYAAEITLGLEHLHKCHILYRDLKPENILLDDTGHVRISDLGLAVELIDDAPVKGRVGTVGYMSPELVENQPYSYSVDVWALGCLIYEMIEGRSPFRQRREKAKREEIDRRVVHDEEKYSAKFSEHAKSLCKGLLIKDPALRLGCSSKGIAQVRAHPFFNTVNWARLEAGKVEPLFVPDPNAVYAKDVLDIEQFSTIKGVKLEPADETFYKKFATGSVSIPWQNEMIETGCFRELNLYYDEHPLPREFSAKTATKSSSFFGRLFHRKDNNKR